MLNNRERDIFTELYKKLHQENSFRYTRSDIRSFESIDELNNWLRAMSRYYQPFIPTSFTFQEGQYIVVISYCNQTVYNNYEVIEKKSFNDLEAFLIFHHSLVLCNPINDGNSICVIVAKK